MESTLPYNGSACELSGANNHALDCGHTVTTSLGEPCTDMQKSACASNCKRNSSDVSYDANTNATLVPFICPICLETSVRLDYATNWKKYQAAGFHPSPEPDINVAIWVYCSVRALAKVGLRAAQGDSGVFLLGYGDEYNHIDFVPSIIETTIRCWEFRDYRSGGKGREKSQSPRRDVDENNDRGYRKRSQSPRRDVYENDDRKYRQRSPLRRIDDFVVDELAKELRDIREGSREDANINGLLVDFEAFRALGNTMKDKETKS